MWRRKARANSRPIWAMSCPDSARLGRARPKAGFEALNRESLILFRGPACQRSLWKQPERETDEVPERGAREDISPHGA